jgi:hypothetical protein
MTFRRVVEATPEIADAYRPGLQALRAVDRARVAAQRPRALRGSVDLDGALAVAYPDANRWDYGIGVQQVAGEKVYWTEVHPARDGEIDVMRQKLDWLKRWLQNSAEPLDDLPREFVWIASGGVAITQSSPRLRGLAAQGLVFKGGHFRIP